jgi:hemolysin activation/secretion protein
MSIVSAAMLSSIKMNINPKRALLAEGWQGVPAGAIAGLPSGVLAAILAWSAPAVLAQSAMPSTGQPAAAPAVTFPISAFTVTGENPLDGAETVRILAPFVRADASLDTLQQAAAALEGHLRDKGFGLYRVALPPQQISSTVALNIVRFKIARVTVEGALQYDEANIRRSLPDLQEGTTPNFQRLAVQTAMANESLGKQIQVAVRESVAADSIDVNVLVKETKPWQLTTTATNAGSAATGRDRLTLAVGHANVFRLDHQLSTAYTTSTERADAVKQLGLSYRAPIYARQIMLGASYTRSDVVGSFGTFTSTGAGRTMGLSAGYYFAPRQGYRSTLSAGLDDKQFEPSKINGTPLVGQLLRRSRQLSLAYVARQESDSALWGYNVELATNLPGGQGNNLAAYQTEDPRITTARWKALRASGSYSAGFAGNWVWGVRASLQLSPDALISGEQFGLGGASSVRGTSERPIAGDRGVLSTMELTTPELQPGLRLIGFVDAGWLGNNQPNGTTKPASDRLTGAGIGLRFGTPVVNLSADYGRIITGSVVPQTLNSLSPQRADAKIHLNLTARF